MARTEQGVTLLEDNPPTTEPDVQRFEVQLGHRLPSDYRAFLLLCNGGRADPASFVFGSGLRSSGLFFYPLPEAEEWRALKDLLNMPPGGLLPIATARRGVILLGIDAAASSCCGQVWFSFMAPGREIELVAESFDAFMRKLEQEPPPPPSRKVTTKQGVELTLNTPPATEEAVLALERQIGHRLPEDYREFLLQHNGGKPEPDSFTFVQRPYGDSDTDSVRSFLTLSDDEDYAIENNIATYKGRIPRATIPIAEDGFGNPILLGLDGDDDVGQPVRGKVYFWDHELEPQNAIDWSNVSPIAESFDAFMRGLKT